MPDGTGTTIAIHSPRSHAGRSSFDRLVRFLDPEEFRAVCVIDCLCARLPPSNGPPVHGFLAEWLRTAARGDAALKHWVVEHFVASSLRAEAFDSARSLADRYLKRGFWGAVWDPDGFAPGKIPECPPVLFGFGSLFPAPGRAAFFNSRKERLPSPESTWLKAVRELLPAVVSKGVGLASSLGTLTYDLAAAYAVRRGVPLLLVAAAGVEASRKGMEAFAGRSHEGIGVACMLSGRCGPKARRMACRDRLLALLSDLHVIIEIRSGGNLLKTLLDQQFLQPRARWIVMPPVRQAANAGNFQLAGECIHRVQRISVAPSAPLARTGSPSRAGKSRRLLSRDLRRDEYVYHYTRSCPGPWPGQSRGDYLRSLLEREPGSGHNALDTLSRILAEGRIRGSTRLVRGTDPVVSWSARTPWELMSIRHWSRALIRWTFEPYGIAVRKTSVRNRGGKPAVYVAARFHQRLALEDRHRFQRHEPPSCAWKHEREWRTEGDFELEGLGEDEAFIFVPDSRDADTLQERVSSTLPVLVPDAAPDPK